jgi:hypothetical protein
VRPSFYPGGSSLLPEEHVRARTEAIMAIGREAASRVPPEFRDKDWDAELYDEYGLPR